MSEPRKRRSRKKNPAAVALGRAGGLASAKRPAKVRKAAAAHAARARWAKLAQVPVEGAAPA